MSIKEIMTLVGIFMAAAILWAARSWVTAWGVLWGLHGIWPEIEATARGANYGAFVLFLIRGYLIVSTKKGADK